MAPRTIVGPLWWESCRYPGPGAPLLQHGIGMEERHPWRTGGCRIVRLPLTRWALAVGTWTGRAPAALDEDGAPVLVLREIGGWDGVGSAPEGF
jgi:hypothetical protein